MGRHLCRPGEGRLTLSLLAILMLAGMCAAQSKTIQGNRISAAAAAGVGQREPGPAGEPAMKSPEDSGVDVSTLTPQQRQQRELMKLRFAEMKQSAGQLAQLAASLEKDLNASNPNLLSLSVVEKTKEIEKLAKKIRNDARFGK